MNEFLILLLIDIECKVASSAALETLDALIAEVGQQNPTFILIRESILPLIYRVNEETLPKLYNRPTCPLEKQKYAESVIIKDEYALTSEGKFHNQADKRSEEYSFAVNSNKQAQEEYLNNIFSICNSTQQRSNGQSVDTQVSHPYLAFRTWKEEALEWEKKIQ